MIMIIVTCPTSVIGKQCSGHGVCWNMADIAASNAISTPTVYGSTLLSRNTITWDYDVMMGCICNSSWKVGFGANEYQLGEYYLPDCSYSKIYK